MTVNLLYLGINALSLYLLADPTASGWRFWAVIGMGVGAAAIEVGFMVAYRMGWRMSTTAVATNVAAPRRRLARRRRRAGAGGTRQGSERDCAHPS